MGCDIHPYIEVNRTFGGKRDPLYPWWALRSIIRMSRDYNVFGILAGVRSNWLKSISEPKGLPVPSGVDYDQIYEKLYKAWATDHRDKESEYEFREALEWSVSSDLMSIFLHGHVDYHSTSWLTLRELKSYDWDQEIEVDKIYTLNAKQSEDSRKEAYIAVKDLDKDDPQYAELARKAFDTWRAEMNQLVKVPLRTFIKGGSEDRNIFTIMDEMERVRPKDGTDDDVRLVFWFDN